MFDVSTGFIWKQFCDACGRWGHAEDECPYVCRTTENDDKESAPCTADAQS